MHNARGARRGLRLAKHPLAPAAPESKRQHRGFAEDRRLLGNGGREGNRGVDGIGSFRSGAVECLVLRFRFCQSIKMLLGP